MILGELTEHGVHAQVSVAPRPTGTFLLAASEVLTDRGASRELALPETIDADVVLVSGYLDHETITRALARAQARGSRSTRPASPSCRRAATRSSRTRMRPAG
jgi:hypothetical protein